MTIRLVHRALVRSALVTLARHTRRHSPNINTIDVEYTDNEKKREQYNKYYKEQDRKTRSQPTATPNGRQSQTNLFKTIATVIIMFTRY